MFVRKTFTPNDQIYQTRFQTKDYIHIFFNITMVIKKNQAGFFQASMSKDPSLVFQNKILRQWHFKHHYSKPQAAIQIPLLHYFPVAKHTASMVYQLKKFFSCVQTSYRINVFYHEVKTTQFTNIFKQRFKTTPIFPGQCGKTPKRPSLSSSRNYFLKTFSERKV